MLGYTCKYELEVRTWGKFSGQKHDCYYGNAATMFADLVQITITTRNSLLKKGQKPSLHSGGPHLIYNSLGLGPLFTIELCLQICQLGCDLVNQVLFSPGLEQGDVALFI